MYLHMHMHIHSVPLTHCLFICNKCKRGGSIFYINCSDFKCFLRIFINTVFEMVVSTFQFKLVSFLVVVGPRS